MFAKDYIIFSNSGKIISRIKSERNNKKRRLTNWFKTRHFKKTKLQKKTKEEIE